jgi:hypothetical protein
MLVGRQPTLAYLLLVAMRPTLAVLLLVTMQRDNTAVVSISMELFDYGYLVTTRVLHSNHGLRLNTSHYLCYLPTDSWCVHSVSIILAFPGT